MTIGRHWKQTISRFEERQLPPSPLGSESGRWKRAGRSAGRLGQRRAKLAGGSFRARKEFHPLGRIPPRRFEKGAAARRLHLIRHAVREVYDFRDLTCRRPRNRFHMDVAPEAMVDSEMLDKLENPCHGADGMARNPYGHEQAIAEPSPVCRQEQPCESRRRAKSLRQRLDRTHRAEGTRVAAGFGKEQREDSSPAGSGTMNSPAYRSGFSD